MWWLIIPALLVIFICILLVRAIRFTPTPEVKQELEKEVFDSSRTIDCLRKLIRCKTVSYSDASLEDDTEFEKLISLLPSLYPNVFNKCSFDRFDDRALLFKWNGKNADEPVVLMAHYDVVPVNEELWEKPPFEGIYEDGVIWGRGALDTKVTLNGILFAAEHLISQGFEPENDIYFAFSGGEEVNGKGAVNIVDYFEKNNIVPAFVLDEGGAVVEGVFPGVSKPCGLIGIAEKGLMNVEYTAKSSGGHASAPKPDAPIDILAKACCKVLSKPFKSHITPPVKKLFDTLGRHSTFVYRIIFSNLWLFSPVLDLICKKSGGELNALMRTTVAFTQMSGSAAANVIPPEAKLISNIRLNPEDTVESATEYIKNIINDDRITVSVMNGTNPSRISTTDSAGYQKIKSAVSDTWNSCLVAPYLMVQCSDSRHWGKISDKVYRFSAMDLTAEERATIHGNNERIRVECANHAVEFYIRLIKQC